MIYWNILPLLCSVFAYLTFHLALQQSSLVALQSFRHVTWLLSCFHNEGAWHMQNHRTPLAIRHIRTHGSQDPPSSRATVGFLSLRSHGKYQHFGCRGCGPWGRNRGRVVVSSPRWPCEVVQWGPATLSAAMFEFRLLEGNNTTVYNILCHNYNNQ